MKDELEFEFLNDIATKEMDIVAQEWAKRMDWETEKAEANARAWLHRIRVKVKRMQSYLNKIYALQKRSARLRKFTLSGALPEMLEEDMEVE